VKRETEQFLSKLQEHSARRKRFEQRPCFWRQTVYSGTLGLIFILPIIAGAYLGAYLDSRLTGYSISWTMNFILLGVIIGGVNAFLFVKDRS
jgi:ATP synthase protein I